MNKLAKQLIGAAIGGALGYFVGAVIAEVIALKEWQRDHPGEDYNDWDDDMVDGDENDPTEQLDPKEPAIFMGHNKKAKKLGVVKNYTQHFVSEGRPELAALVAKYNGNEELLEDVVVRDTINIEDEMEKLEMPETVEEKDISVVSLAQFANTELEVVSLNFYDDDVVTDQHDNPIDRPERILGDEALVSFGVGSQDEDVVYVQNLTKKCMYEVVRTNKDYAVKQERRAKKDAMRKHLNKEEDYGEDNT